MMKVNLTPIYFREASDPDFSNQVSIIKVLLKDVVDVLQPTKLGDALPNETDAVVFPQMLGDAASLLRILHYPPLTGDEEENAVRAAAHEDINMITLLPVAEQPGLQVRDTDGTWIDVASIPGELVVNSGDMLREITAGYFPSTTHRVLNPGDNIANESRISIPFFLTPRFEIRLSEKYTSGSYLEERLKLITGQA